jgi:hypothetical protein
MAVRLSSPGAATLDRQGNGAFRASLQRPRGELLKASSPRLVELHTLADHPLFSRERV